MSMSFNRVNKITETTKCAFAMADDVFEYLLGDGSMPYAVDDTYPEVVRVSTSKVAAILVKAGRAKKADVPPWLYYEFNDEYENMGNTGDRAAEMVREDDYTSRALLCDYRHAVKRESGVILYRLT
jgi:hypothetical protein